jgi:arylsulfatase A-like enzyme
MAITMDWTATILAAAKTDADARHAFDGIDLLPVLKGSNPLGDRIFFWRISNQDAAREGRWKFFRKGDVRHLYNLSIDQHEQADFSQKHPEILQRLMGEFDKWNDQMLPRPRPRR